jgi:phage terminase Nu1 subunit (DNA packaging protein)
MEYNQLNNAVVSSEDLCKILPIKNRNYIAELVRFHNFPRIAHNEYPLIKFVQRYIEYQNELNEKRIAKVRDESSTRSRLERAQAETKEFDLEVKKGSLVNIDVVKDAWFTETQMIINQLETFPIFVAASLLGITDQKTMQELLTTHINQIRIRIANQKLKLLRNKKTSNQLNSISGLDEDSFSEDDMIEVNESDETKEIEP